MDVLLKLSKARNDDVGLLKFHDMELHVRSLTTLGLLLIYLLLTI